MLHQNCKDKNTDSTTNKKGARALVWLGLKVVPCNNMNLLASLNANFHRNFW